MVRSVTTFKNKHHHNYENTNNENNQQDIVMNDQQNDESTTHSQLTLQTLRQKLTKNNLLSIINRHNHQFESLTSEIYSYEKLRFI